LRVGLNKWTDRKAARPKNGRPLQKLPQASENPLDNIQAVRKVSFVMEDGKVFKNE
jgi:hypothetical protein